MPTPDPCQSYWLICQLMRSPDQADRGAAQELAEAMLGAHKRRLLPDFFVPRIEKELARG